MSMSLSLSSSEAEPESIGMYVNSEEVVTDAVHPVFELLMECKDPVSNIVKELTPGMMSPALQLSLDTRGIRTIGQFSSLTCAALLHLPIGPPRIEHTLEVLQRYHSELLMKNDHDDASNTQQSSEHFMDSLMNGFILNSPVPMVEDNEEALLGNEPQQEQDVPELIRSLVTKAKGEDLQLATRTVFNAMSMEQKSKFIRENFVIRLKES